MANYAEQMQEIVRHYQDAGQRWPATAKDIAGWAIENRYWHPQPSSVIAQCADHIARAMREEYITDPQGRRVRAKHVANISVDGEQIPLWADIRTAPREHMAAAFQQRRHQIVGDCRQLKSDMDSYNDNTNAGATIQMIFDFTLDLEELERAAA